MIQEINEEEVKKEFEKELLKAIEIYGAVKGVKYPQLDIFIADRVWNSLEKYTRMELKTKEKFFEELQKRTPVSEYEKGIIKTLSNRWKTLFPNPKNGPARFLGSSYYVDFPHLRLIALDTDGLFWMSDYTQVSFWLKNTLRDARDKFTIVMMHHPVYSTAKGRNNPLIWLALHDAMRNADVVFSGHDHNYARHTEYYKARFWKKEEPTIFIATNASSKNYSVKENNKYEASFSGEPVYEHIFITPTSLSVHTYNLNSGVEIDKIEIRK